MKNLNTLPQILKSLRAKGFHSSGNNNTLGYGEVTINITSNPEGVNQAKVIILGCNGKILSERVLTHYMGDKLVTIKYGV